MPIDDAWERFEYRVPLRAFGSGSRHNFDWYFEGQSAVSVSSIQEIQDWLLGCEYVHDMELFHESDFWQHPQTFEQLRRGDCEDHALWAWRKLVELGHDADLVSGKFARDADAPETPRGHVWVLLRRGGDTLVFETVAKTKDRMFRPLGEIRDAYRPEYGVDARRQRYAFNGAVLSLRESNRDSSAQRTA